MSLKSMAKWIRGKKKNDSLIVKPLLSENLVVFFSFSDEGKAYILDVVLREIFMEIDVISHDMLELANGKRTIGEIASQIKEKFPEKYGSIEKSEEETSNFFQTMNSKGITRLIDHD